MLRFALRPRAGHAKPAIAGDPSPIRRQTLVDITLDAVRERILSGAYPEGKALRQDAIAEELGVSKIPIREALRQLETEGLVVFNPHRGAVVSSLSLDEIQEVFELRADLETALLRRAIARMDSEHLEIASEVLTQYEIALRRRDVVSYGRLNWEFHSTLYDAADRRIALSIVQRLHQQCDRYVRMQLAFTHGEARANRQHRAILAAVRRRDVKRAVALLREDILGAGESLTTFLREYRAGQRARHTRARA